MLMFPSAARDYPIPSKGRRVGIIQVIEKKLLDFSSAFCGMGVSANVIFNQMKRFARRQLISFLGEKREMRNGSS